ncbi:MAG: DUF3604 domain-containing protein, partial [Gemmatimonadetes bacterium]|nr:DUF3604 domain-containing protein [Gemmatimonadota bacterium]
WTNTIGAPELITVWTDPDFDPNLPTVYYAREHENPTPRRTSYEAKRFGITMEPEVPMITRERAYTSPIWYTPYVVTATLLSASPCLPRPLHAPVSRAHVVDSPSLVPAR